MESPAAATGSFAIELPPLPAKMDILDFLASDDEDFKTIYLNTMELVQLSASSVPEDIQNIITQPAITDLPPPETPAPGTSSPTKKRFKTTTAEEIDHLFGARHTSSTKRNTAWGMKIFQGIFI